MVKRKVVYILKKRKSKVKTPEILFDKRKKLLTEEEMKKLPRQAHKKVYLFQKDKNQKTKWEGRLKSFQSGF